MSSLPTTFPKYLNLKCALRCEEATGTRYDASGNGFAWNGDGVGSAPGKIGRCAFVSAGAPLVCSPSFELNSWLKWSFATWVKITAPNVQTVGHNLLLQWMSPTEYDLTLSVVSGNTVKFFVTDGDYNALTTATITATQTNWNHVCLSFDTGTLKIYVNSLLDSTTSISDLNNFDQATMLQNVLGGGMAQDLISFWNINIDQDDVDYLYNANAGRDFPFSASENGRLPYRRGQRSLVLGR